MRGQYRRLCLTLTLFLVLLLSGTQAEAKKEFTRKQVGNFFRQYPKMEKLIFKAIRSEKNNANGRTSRAAPDPNNCPAGTDKCCFTFRNNQECYCCS